MNYLRESEQKKYEDASLFKDFVKVVNLPHQNLEKDEKMHRLLRPELSMARRSVSMCHISMDFDEFSSAPDAPRFVPGCFPHAGQPSPEYYSFDPNSFAHEQQRLPRQRFMSLDESVDSLAQTRTEAMEYSGPEQGFVCAYCDAKYVYKRCLINHMFKSHRKLAE